ncbi:MAG: winged helix-turn-helix domain-containing protein [Acidimicrobiia bacterium]
MTRLGAFTFDLGSRELWKAERRVHLPAQSAQLLALLIAKAPEVVTRDEIRRALWGDGLHVEFDSAIHACVSQIRSALGDNARAPRFVETVPRRGYRCLVERSEVPTATVPRSFAAPLVERSVERPANVRMLMVALSAAVALLVWTAMPSARGPASASLVALQKYERGISGLADASPTELLARVRHFEAAIVNDQEFAAAYAGLAEAKLLLGAYRVEPPQTVYAAAKAAAQTALTLDDSLAEAHAVFGASALYFEWDWTLARQHLRRAIALDSKSGRVQLWWSRYLTAAGEHQAAISAAQRAVTLWPGSPSALTQLGMANHYAGRPADARTRCGDALALMREVVPARACLEAAEARAERSPNLLLAPAVELVRNGDRERAIEWLQRAANRRSDSVLLAAVEPTLEPLRGDPRFSAVIRRVGAPAWVSWSP